MKATDIVILFDIDNTLFNTLQLKNSNLTIFEAYDEVVDTLEKLSKVAELGIFSQGEVAFQKRKLHETNIARYFFEEHTHIAVYKIAVMKEILEKYHGIKKVFFVDDLLESLRVAKETDPSVFTIWIKRGEYADVQEEHAHFTPDAIIKNVAEVIPLVNQL